MVDARDVLVSVVLRDVVTLALLSVEATFHVVPGEGDAMGFAPVADVLVKLISNSWLTVRE